MLPNSTAVHRELMFGLTHGQRCATRRCVSSGGRPMREEPAMINSTSNEGKHVQHHFLERGESVPAGGGHGPWIRQYTRH